MNTHSQPTHSIPGQAKSNLIINLVRPTPYPPFPTPIYAYCIDTCQTVSIPFRGFMGSQRGPSEVLCPTPAGSFRSSRRSRSAVSPRAGGRRNGPINGAVRMPDKLHRFRRDATPPCWTSQGSPRQIRAGRATYKAAPARLVRYRTQVAAPANLHLSIHEHLIARFISSSVTLTAMNTHSQLTYSIPGQAKSNLIVNLVRPTPYPPFPTPIYTYCIDTCQTVSIPFRGFMGSQRGPSEVLCPAPADSFRSSRRSRSAVSPRAGGRRNGPIYGAVRMPDKRHRFRRDATPPCWTSQGSPRQIRAGRATYKAAPARPVRYRTQVAAHANPTPLDTRTFDRPLHFLFCCTDAHEHSFAADAFNPWASQV